MSFAGTFWVKPGIETGCVTAKSLSFGWIPTLEDFIDASQIGWFMYSERFLELNISSYRMSFVLFLNMWNVNMLQKNITKQSSNICWFLLCLRNIGFLFYMFFKGNQQHRSKPPSCSAWRSIHRWPSSGEGRRKERWGAVAVGVGICLGCWKNVRKLRSSLFCQASKHLFRCGVSWFRPFAESFCCLEAT